MPLSGMVEMSSFWVNTDLMYVGFGKAVWSNESVFVLQLLYS